MARQLGTDVTPVVVPVDQVLAAHLYRALTVHRRWCQANHHAWPPALGALVEVVDAVSKGRSVDSDGQEWPDGRDVPWPAHDASVILLPFDEVGRRLGGVSERSVRRLVVAGELPAVGVGGARRVHVDDLAAYTQALRSRHAAAGADLTGAGAAVDGGDPRGGGVAPATVRPRTGEDCSSGCPHCPPAKSPGREAAPGDGAAGVPERRGALAAGAGAPAETESDRRAAGPAGGR